MPLCSALSAVTIRSLPAFEGPASLNIRWFDLGAKVLSLTAGFCICPIKALSFSTWDVVVQPLSLPLKASAPAFIIWTLQRTGGTTFAQLMMQSAGGRMLSHEPFNLDRLFGPLTQAWIDSGDNSALHEAMRQALTPPGTLKHCFEILPQPISDQLLEVAQLYGYRHLILDRRSEPDRLLSLLAARLTGAWGPAHAQKIYAEIEGADDLLPEAQIDDWLAQARHSHARRTAMAKAFRRHGLEPEVLIFEDLYASPETGRAEINRAAEALGIDYTAHPSFAARREQALREGNQNSPRILSRLPNLEALRAALTACPEAAPFDWAAALRGPR